MRILIITGLLIGGIFTLSSCGNAKMDDVAFNNMVKESWQKRKVAVADSMNRVCADRMQNQLSASVDSVLTKRGIKISFLIACNQQQDVTGKVQAEVNDRVDAMIDSLKRVCNNNFETALQSRVTAAIKANNKPAAQAKPSIKASTKPKNTPAKTTAPPPPPPPKPISKGGRKGVGKGGNVIKNQGTIKTAPPVQTKPGTTKTTTTTQPSGIKTRSGVKDKKEE